MVLSKSHLNRLSRVHASLTPKQLVLQDVLEAAKYPSFVEYAAAVGEGRVQSGDTLMERIARSVKARTRGASRQDEQAVVRRAQKDGLFLGKLVVHANTAVLRSAERWRLHATNCATMILLIAHADALADDEFERVAASAECLFTEFTLSVTAHRLAAAHISKTYFDGTDVLHPWTRSTLDHYHGYLAGTLKPLSLLTSADSMPEPPEQATYLAREWVLMAKAQVHDAFGETASGLRALASVMQIKR